MCVAEISVSLLILFPSGVFDFERVARFIGAKSNRRTFRYDDELFFASYRAKVIYTEVARVPLQAPLQFRSSAFAPFHPPCP